MKKAQAAMEFLATYGWAMLVVLIVIGALAYFGVFDALNLLPQTCVISPRFSCSDFSVDVSSAKVFVNVRNSGGKDAYVSSFTATAKDGSFRCSVNFPGTITLTSNEATGFETLPCTKPDGSPIGDTSVLLKKQKYVLEIGYADSPGGYSKQANGELFAQGAGGATNVQQGDPVTVAASFNFNDGSAADTSGNGNDGVINGGAVLSSKSGSALAFSKSGSLTVPSSPSLQHNGDYTIAAWFYLNSWTNYNAIMAKSDYPSGPTQYQMQMSDAVRPRAMYTYAGGNGGQGARVDSAANYVETGKWTFAVITYKYESPNTIVKFYKNGGLHSQGTAAGKTLNANAQLRIGNSILDGFVDNVRVYKRTLSADEVLQFYGDSVPSGSLAAEWKFDEYSGSKAIDSSGNNNDAAINGGVVWSGKSGSAFIFDGSNDYVSVPDSQSLQLTGDMTLSFWMKKNADAGEWSRIVGKGSSTMRNYGVWQETGATKRLLFQQYNSGAAVLSVMSTAQIANDKWYHVAAVVKGNEGHIYINGVLDSSGTRTGLPSTSQDPFTIGYAGYHRYFNGIIEDVTIYSRALTQQEITALGS